MSQKTTEELDNILKNTQPENIEDFLETHAAHMMAQDKLFSEYMHQMLRKNALTQQEVFLQADFPERYGYKLLSEEKHTRQRDYILRICYAANMTLDETQKALTLYGMAPLYARIPRDAVLMIAFNQRKGSILEVNALLSSHNLPALKTCGNLE